MDIKKELESFEMKTIEYEDRELVDLYKCFGKDIKEMKKNIKQSYIVTQQFTTENEVKDELIQSLKIQISKFEKHNEKIGKKIINILDQIDNIYNFAKQAKNEALIKNLEMVNREIRKNLRTIGIEEIPAIGEKFDEEIHDAIDAREGTGKSKYEIIDVLKKGYKLNGKILRIAQVIAAK